MIHIKDHKTPDMFDRFPFLGPKRKNLIETSWAKVFREHILPTLPVNKVLSQYDPVMGAPTKELYAILGLMVIQQMHDLTDDEAVSQFAFNMQWHYALNITSTADADAYVSPKTLWNMRDILTEQGIYTTIFEEVTKTLAEIFSVDVSKQRFDSVHIFSNMRHLGRIGLFVKTIKKFLVNLKRHHKELYESLDKALADRYMTKQGEAVFSMVKPSESTKTLATLADDVFTLAEQFRGNDPVITMTSYQLLARLLKEQCIVERVDTHTTQVSVKANKDVPSDSLQNPSDPDAGYDGHKGKGYQVQIASDGRQAMNVFEKQMPDFVILDLMLPEVDGLSLTRWLRDRSNVPIIMLTARREEIDRIAGLEMGADDYVVKPFSPQELVSRVRAVMRRLGREQPEAESERSLEFDGLTINPRSRVVTVSNSPVELTAREFDMLYLLAQYPKQVFTREQLLERIWGGAQYIDPGTVTVHVRRLREKIEEDPSHPTRLLTVWGVGYKFEP